MAILFVFDRDIIPSQGGIERVTSLLAEELARRGRAVSYLSISPAEKGTSVPGGIEQHNIPFGAADFNERFLKLLREKDVDTVILQGAARSVVSVLDSIPEDVSRLLVLHIRPHVFHGCERKIMKLTPWKGLGRKKMMMKALSTVAPALVRRINLRRYNALYRRIISRADRMVLLGKPSLERLASLTAGIDRTRLAAINNPNTFKVSEGNCAADKENLIIFVGRLSNPQKNVTGFVDVWKEAAGRLPGWRAVVIGDGEHRDLIMRYAAKKKAERLTFAGNTPDVEAYYRKAKILCMTSTYEGWGMVLTEAMAYGCVPVAYDSYEAIRDIITDGETGRLVAPFKTEEMATALATLAGDEALRGKIASAGMKKVEDFNVEGIVDEWERLLDEIRREKVKKEK